MQSTVDGSWTAVVHEKQKNRTAGIQEAAMPTITGQERAPMDPFLLGVSNATEARLPHAALEDKLYRVVTNLPFQTEQRGILVVERTVKMEEGLEGYGGP